MNTIRRDTYQILLRSGHCRHARYRYTDVMFALELTFDDDQRRLDVRPAHRERLNQLHAEGKLVLAGPWRDDSGALLVFSADRATVDQIIAADPYCRTPGVTIASIREWNAIVGP